MQTFMTRYGMWSTARDLDDKRLFKQVVEAKQIAMWYFCYNEDFPGNHPATKMWDGHEHYLLNYGAVMAGEVCRRNDTMTAGQHGAALEMMAWFAKHQKQFRLDFPGIPATQPDWMRSREFILSHRSNLVRKDEAYYGRLFPTVDADRPYLWPLPALSGPTRYYLSAAEARRVDPNYLPTNWTVNWDTREVTFS